MNNQPKKTRTILAKDELSVFSRESEVLETEEDIAKAYSETSADTFWPFLETLADECDAILIANGFPRAAAMVVHEGDGAWRAISAEDHPKRISPKQTVKLTRGFKLVEDFAEPLSDSWFAGKLGLDCRVAIEHFKNGRGHEPFLHEMIFHIAILRRDWEWRSKNKPSILTGRKQRASLKYLRESHNEEKKRNVEHRRELIVELLRQTNRTKGALEEWIKEQLCTKHQIYVSLRTVRSDLKALRA